MSDPIPPAEWEARVGSGNDEDRGPVFPPRPDVVEVTETEPAGSAEGTVGSEGTVGHQGLPGPEQERSERTAPAMLPPEGRRRPMWRRPAGQRDDKGEPTGAGG